MSNHTRAASGIGPHSEKPKVLRHLQRGPTAVLQTRSRRRVTDPSRRVRVGGAVTRPFWDRLPEGKDVKRAQKPKMA